MIDELWLKSSESHANVLTITPSMKEIMAIQQFLTKERSFLVQWQILGFALLALGGVIAYNLYREHGRIGMVERGQLSTQAKVVEQNMERQLDAINQALAGIRGDLPRWERLEDGKERAASRLTALSEAMTGVRTLLVMNAEGVVTLSNREQVIGRDFSYRDYFQAPLRNPDPETLYISPPFKTMLGVFAMNVSRAIIAPDGRFAGIVSATLNPEEFAVLMNSVLYAPDMWSALAHGDGRQFMMMPEREGMAGMDLARPGTFFTRHRESGRTANTLTGMVYATGEERMIALRTIQPPALRMDKPMVVAVARDLLTVFAPWRRDAYSQSALYGSLVLASVFGLFWYQRRQREYEQILASQEAEQQKSAERLKLATEAAGVGVWEYDLVSESLIWDASMFAIYGVLPKDFSSTYEAWRSALLPEDAGQAEAALWTAIEQGVPFNTSFRICRGDGQVRDIRAMALVHYDESGRPVRMVGTNEDITERKQAEDALRASKASLRALLDNTPYLMWLKDTDSRFIAVNKAFVLSSGKADAAEIIGRTDFDLWPRELATRYRAEDVEVMTSLNQKLIEEQEIHHGQRCWMEVFKTPILNQDGQLLGTAGFAQDISERRERERQRLADAVAHRDTLVREVHHRIKNNLQSVAGLLRLELGKYLEMNPRLEKAIGQVHAIAAVHGLQSASPEETTLLSDTVREICHALQEQFQRPVVFRIENEPSDFVPVQIDKEEAVAIALVLNELILNAVKHTPEGGIDPVVALRSDGHHAQVSICNSLAGSEGGDFDFASDRGINTGLRLVRSLLPKQGAELSYAKDGEKRLVTRLLLAAPVVEPVTPETGST